MQYTDLTHEIRRFLVYIFLGLNLLLLKDQRFVYMIRIRYRRVKTRVTLASTLGERLRTKIPYSRTHTCKDNCDKIISKFIRHMFNYLFKDTRIVKNQLNYPSFNCYPAMHTQNSVDSNRFRFQFNIFFFLFLNIVRLIFRKYFYLQINATSDHCYRRNCSNFQEIWDFFLSQIFFKCYL